MRDYYNRLFNENKFFRRWIVAEMLILLPFVLYAVFSDIGEINGYVVSALGLVLSTLLAPLIAYHLTRSKEDHKE